MRRLLLGLVTGLVFAPVHCVADDAQSTRACDLAAANAYDRTRPAGIPGIDIEKIDPKLALPACQAALAAAPNNPRLLYQMGRILDASKAEAQALPFYEKAAAQGHASAQTWLGFLYANGRGGLAKNDQEALRLLRLASNQGHPISQTWLGLWYANGSGGLTKNDQEAARLYKLAADQGYAPAQAYLGALNATGRGRLAAKEPNSATVSSQKELSKVSQGAAQSGHEATNDNVNARPASSATAAPAATGRGECVAECTSFEKRCKSPTNTSNALKNNGMGSLGVLGILLGMNEICTKAANQCAVGCAKNGKAIVTLRVGTTKMMDIPAKDAASAVPPRSSVASTPPAVATPAPKPAVDRPSIDTHPQAVVDDRITDDEVTQDRAQFDRSYCLAQILSKVPHRETPAP